MDVAAHDDEFPAVKETLRHVRDGVKSQKKNYLKAIEKSRARWHYTRPILPILGFAAAASIALAQSSHVAGSGYQPFFAVLGILSSTASAAFATWVGRARYEDTYLAKLETYYALGRLQDRIEFALKRARESNDVAKVTPKIVDEWAEQLEWTLRDAGVRFSKLLEAKPGRDTAAA